MKSEFEKALTEANIWHIKTNLGVSMNLSDMDIEKYGDMIRGYDDHQGGMIIIPFHLIR